jgi:hypothetical protein
LVRPMLWSSGRHTDIGSLEVSSDCVKLQTQQFWHSWDRLCWCWFWLHLAVMSLMARSPRIHGCYEHVGWMNHTVVQFLRITSSSPVVQCLESSSIHMVSLMLNCGLVIDVHQHLVFKFHLSPQVRLCFCIKLSRL